VKHARPLAAGVAVAVALGLAFVAGRGTQNVAVGTSVAVAQHASPDSADEAAERRGPPSASTTAGDSERPIPALAGAPELPLPPHDTPLNDARDELEDRARRGDRKAACRLAMDANFCRSNPAGSDPVGFFEHSIAQEPSTSDADVAWIARLEQIQQRARRICADLPPDWVEDASWRWTLQAARAGDDFLAARFVISAPMSDRDFLERPEPWQQYRDHAVPLIQSAAARGQVEAIWFLQRLHRGATQLRGMPNAIERDPRLAAVYAVALRSVTQGASLLEFEQALTRARDDYDAGSWAAIEAEGTALAQRHFADVAPRDFQTGVYGDIDSRRCDDATASASR
jgi:hypothetical protein